MPRHDNRATELRRTNTLLRRLITGLKLRLDDELRPENVTTSQLRLLKEVRDRPGGSGAEMARACFVTPQSAQTNLARAVKQGWVIRGKDPVNQRLVTAHLTLAGERLLAHAENILMRLEEEVWAGVSRKELESINDLLERPVRILHPQPKSKTFTLRRRYNKIMPVLESIRKVNR